jgi:cephalosporin hydroxylase
MTTVVRTVQRALAHELRTLRGALYRRLAISPRTERKIVDQFHQLYFDSAAFNMTWRNTNWMGHRILKCPLDLWLYQETLFRLRPAFVIETGTAFGGSAHFLASMMDILGHGRVVTMDLEHREGRPQHPRITYLTGSSVAPDMVDHVRSIVASASPVMVILDSDHSRDHVLAELDTYAPFVTPGSYLVVEDTNLNGHPVFSDHGPGPMEALETFLRHHPEFAHDPDMDKFLLTFNPKGFLKRSA